MQRTLDKEGYTWQVKNLGISGDTTEGGVSRINSAVRWKPSVVVLELGGNDGLRGLPLKVTRQNLETMIMAFQEAGAKVVLAGMTLPPNYGPDYIKSFEAIYKDLAAKYKAEADSVPAGGYRDAGPAISAKGWNPSDGGRGRDRIGNRAEGGKTAFKIAQGRGMPRPYRSAGFCRGRACPTLGLVLTLPGCRHPAGCDSPAHSPAHSRPGTDRAPRSRHNPRALAACGARVYRAARRSERLRLALLEQLQEVSQRDSRIDDILDHDHVEALNRVIQILGEPRFALKSFCRCSWRCRRTPCAPESSSRAPDPP